MTQGLTGEQAQALQGQQSTEGASNSATADAERRRLFVLGVKAMHAFHRDLEQLMKERPRQWVAYHGEQQVGFGATKFELLQDCIRRGVSPEEILIRSIEPEMPELVVPPLPAD